MEDLGVAFDLLNSSSQFKNRLKIRFYNNGHAIVLPCNIL